ncbi:MAG: NAD-dependent epimerase/dehydratase family protein [Gammaproteobacteria bacterium]
MILVTGSKGLIGTALIDYFTNQNISFQSFDLSYPHDNYNHGDILNLKSPSITFENITGVVHLAAVSRVITAENNPQDAWLTNTMGTYNLLNALYNTQHKPWFIYASSREVYGQQTKFPVSETATLLPMNHYAYSKFSAEKIVHTFKERGMKTQVLRFSSVYGATNDHPDRVIPAFCQAAIQKKPLRIDGRDNILDFTHVKDVARGIFKTITALEQNKPMPPAIHLTSGTPTSLYQLANLAQNISGHTCEFIDAPQRVYDVSKFYGDPTLAHEVLGWKTNVTLESGLSMLIRDYMDLEQKQAVNVTNY